MTSYWPDVDGLPCATCGGKGTVPHPTLPYTRADETCRDCQGSGLCPIGEPAVEFDDEYELDETTGLIMRIRGD